MKQSVRARRGGHRTRRTSWPWVFLLVVCTFCASAAHKIQINQAALAGQVIADGGQLIADYGSYQLYRAPQLPAGLTNAAKGVVRDEYNFILLNAGALDTSQPQAKALRKPSGSFSGKRLHLVQFAGPVQPAWHAALTNAGAQVVCYIPHNAYLVYGDAAALGRLQTLATSAAFVQWDGPFLEQYKIHPNAKSTDSLGHPRVVGTDWFAIQLISDPAANPATLRLIQQLALAPIRSVQAVLHYRNVILRLPVAALPQIAAQPDVISIQPFFMPKRFGERQDQIVAGNLAGNAPSGPGYLAWLNALGFTQAQFTNSGFVVDLSDSGVDNGTTNPTHFGLYTGGNPADSSRVSYNRLEGTPNVNSTLAGCDGHGTLNAHIIAGYDDLAGFPFADSSGYHFGLGVCPFVKVGSSVVFDPDAFTFPDYTNLEADAYASGARINNNSWGSASSGAYDVTAQAYDALVRDAQPDGSTFPAPGNQEMTIVFAVGNVEPSLGQYDGQPGLVNSPGTAKNVLTVGAAANVQAFGLSDGCGVPDSDSDNASDVAAFSDHGPCQDGRHKPDLLAPGTHISGGVVQASNPGPNGTADPCFTNDATGICGGASPDLFFPSGQQWYTASSGTSHAAPCVSGGCALLRQWFLNQFTNPPSAAMTKAYLMNSARYLSGVAAGDGLWSDAQGMGELNLGMAFDGTPRFLRDERPEDLFTNSGQTRTFTGTISDTNKPFRVTLAWTDAPGSTAANAYNNNLDLVVIAGGQLYLGNVFKGQFSTTGGAPDIANNVESVFLPPGVSGTFAVEVIATDINSDGVPNNSYPLDQDFALVVYNGDATRTLPVLQGANATLLAESCAPTNGVIDPGETVTISFALQNVGLADTANLYATLLPTGGVTQPSSPQSYGALAAGGPARSLPFTFTAQGNCGDRVTASLELEDGSAGLGTITFSFPLGQGVLVTNFSEDFDSVPPPGLPPGWTSSNSGGGSGWVTSTGMPYTPPNAIGAQDVPTAGLSELTSPVIPISSASAQLSFQNYYDLEAFPSGGGVYHGGVLEIKIGNGPFTDILDAGGAFVSGGYNGRVYTTGDNPLADRAAWGFNSGGFYIPTLVDLPTNAAGQNIQLKWRLGTDTNTAYAGSSWLIDAVAIQDTQYACCNPLVPIISGIWTTPTNAAVSFNSLSGVQYTLQYKNSLSDPQWQSLPPPLAGTGSSLTLTDTNPPLAQRFYRVLAQ